MPSRLALQARGKPVRLGEILGLRLRREVDSGVVTAPHHDLLALLDRTLPLLPPRSDLVRVALPRSQGRGDELARRALLPRFVPSIQTSAPSGTRTSRCAAAGL